ncbi:TetR/AcrR family transcriptional regulator [Goodfellowiella coeruleoviolacea]|uniref:Transcriptional regulator, TetR family n=1 Tax=Goodfellowiella coeruleoviolacea TaxID=334858 RepID=A0AAE3GGT6_9PSEU|nr:TetR/AcrR family transcriptional regulator [Goodfellowiella coeruleoviolacea]MCP2167986.1 transcriptional regulator, TetR family [Goodfellowiella coeruleoviolacea]
METQGLRERKKHRTRRALFEAAVRLFQEKGYEQTTVAEIAAAADVSTKTLFNYFPAKEDILFAYRQPRIDEALRVIAERGQDEDVISVLIRATGQLFDSLADDGADPHDPNRDLVLGRARVELTLGVPELRARALQLIFDTQQQLTTALSKSYPDLDHLTVASVVGALIGAMQAAALVSMERGDSLEQIQAMARQAVHVVLHGARTTLRQGLA